MKYSYRVRVLHLITRLDRGGSAENTVFTAFGLDRRRFEVTLAAGRTVSPTPGLSRFGMEKGRDWIEVPQLVRDIRPFVDLWALIKLYVLIRRGRFHIVHTHSSKAGILGRLAARMAGVPVVVHTPHGHVFYGYYGPVLSRLFVVLEKLLAPLTDRIVTLTERGKREHVEFGVAGPEKFVVVHSGVELGPFLGVRADPEEIKRNLGIAPGDRVVGSLGRLVPIKGHRYLIEAAGLVLRKRPNVTFLLVGDGPLRRELEVLTEGLGIGHKVVFAGHREDEPEVLSAMDIFVLPSLNEGMGRVLVEAMAEGKPVVATDVGGVADVVEDRRTGILVPPRDPEALAEAILELLDDPEKARRFGEAGRERASLFSVERMVEEIEELYEDLLREKGVI